MCGRGPLEPAVWLIRSPPSSVAHEYNRTESQKMKKVEKEEDGRKRKTRKVEELGRKRDETWRKKGRNRKGGKLVKTEKRTKVKKEQQERRDRTPSVFSACLSVCLDLSGDRVLFFTWYFGQPPLTGRSACE